jgi:hypothetical protein
LSPLMQRSSGASQCCLGLCVPKKALVCSAAPFIQI